MEFASQFDTFHQLASDATGLDDFGTDDYHIALRQLLRGIDESAGLSPVGREGLQHRIVGMLVGRLLLHKGLAEHPAVLDSPIEKPLFIVGLPRTGTTVLHRVLSHDPAQQSLPFWLGNMPMPRPPREDWEGNAYFRQVEEGLKNSSMVSKELRQVHPIDADQADECRWGLDQTFWSSSMLYVINSRSYSDWYNGADAHYAYKYYRQLLCLVANGDSRRWVLKDPSHMNGIDALLDVFPDACIVQTHRSPLDCMRSFSSMGWETRKLFFDNARQEAYGQQVLKEWSISLNKMERYREQHDGGRFLDIHMQEIRRDPLGTIERIFVHFDLPVTDEARELWRKKIVEDPSTGHGAKHQPADFGLSADSVKRSMEVYYERYRKVCDAAGLTS